MPPFRMYRCLPFIYCHRHRRPLSFYPPARTDSPLSVCAGLHELSTPGMHSTNVAIGLVLTPPSHPYRQGRRLFSSASTDPRESLSVRKRDVLRCPDFPPVVKHVHDQRQTKLLPYLLAKVRKYQIQCNSFYIKVHANLLYFRVCP